MDTGAGLGRQLDMTGRGHLDPEPWCAANAANAEAPAEGEDGVENTEGTGEHRGNDTNEEGNNDAVAVLAQPLIEV